MEHAEARELLEISAVEPGGLDRLMAGDTVEASALAGHLAGCPDCADEMDRLRRASAVIRRGVISLPPPDLRERTLAVVAAVGRPRGSGALAGAGPVAAAAGSSADRSAVAPPSREPEPVELERARRRPDVPAASGAGVRPRMLAAWAASVAAAIVLSIVGTVSFVDRQRDDVARAQAQQIASLARVADWTLRLDADPDAKYVALASTGTDATATVAFSGTSRQLVVLANGLADPPPGMEYRCWVESGGTREPIGKMFFAGDVSYWAGDVPTVTEALPGTKFGVSLVPIDGSPVGGDPVLIGEL
jgi:hypothetical protein